MGGISEANSADHGRSDGGFCGDRHSTCHVKNSQQYSCRQAQPMGLPSALGLDTDAGGSSIVWREVGLFPRIVSSRPSVLGGNNAP